MGTFNNNAMKVSFSSVGGIMNKRLAPCERKEKRTDGHSYHYIHQLCKLGYKNVGFYEIRYEISMLNIWKSLLISTSFLHLKKYDEFYRCLHVKFLESVIKSSDKLIKSPPPETHTATIWSKDHIFQPESFVWLIFVIKK